MTIPDKDDVSRLRRGIAAALAMLNSTDQNQADTSEASVVLSELLTPQTESIPTQRSNSATEALEIAHLIGSGYRRVLALRLAHIAVSRRTAWPGLTAATGSAALPASLPMLAELVLVGVAPQFALHTIDAIGWVVALFAVNVGAILVAWWCWFILHKGAPDIEALLYTTGDFHSTLARWLRRRFGLLRQLTFAVLAAGGACFLLRLAQPAIAPSLEIGPISYASVGWTGFIAGNLGFWLVIVTRLSQLILHRRDLALVWHSPATTPGMMRLSRGHTFGAAAVLVLAVGVEFLALRVSTYGDSVVLRTVAISFPVLAAITCLVFGVLPHWWLYQAVRNARQQTLRFLAPRAARLPRSATDVAETQGWVSLYSIVESGTGLPFSTGWMVQYAAAVISTLVGTVLAIVLRAGPI